MSFYAYLLNGSRENFIIEVLNLGHATIEVLIHYFSHIGLENTRQIKSRIVTKEKLYITHATLHQCILYFLQPSLCIHDDSPILLRHKNRHLAVLKNKSLRI